jgi:hypothetical protein
MVKKTDAFRTDRMSKLELGRKQVDKESDISRPVAVTKSVSFFGEGRENPSSALHTHSCTRHNIQRINVLQNF